ncbi:MAG TPA: WecB/TagA/CpsF family glycosyltransferase [Verrucomicrobiae bacterium]|nr:WecB/TagA/CpsF family glycosyltransferase [Verrucomicrobiae bacterium]
MKILVIHNYYQHRGGEDAVCEGEVQLLRDAGHEVIVYSRHNDEIHEVGGIQKLRLAWQTIWAARAHDEIRDLIARTSPDVAHLHNTFPLISPSACYACAEAGVPVVQTLHNYRLICPASVFLRDGKVCTLCLGRAVAWPGVLHSCYRDSRSATLATAAMLCIHRALHTWRDKVNVYIALSEFARGKYIAGGIPADRIVVKHNSVCCEPAPRSATREYALYVGRLSEEKGARVLLHAWKKLARGVPLKIVGDGPLRDEVESEIMRGQNEVDVIGRVSPAEVPQWMSGARFLIFPSTCYETFGLTIAEAFACGLPAVASRLGAMAEIVQDGVTGLHFEPGNAADLTAKVEWAWNHPEELLRMGRAARREYEAKYTPERNYRMLMDIYSRAIASRPQQVPASVAHAEVRGRPMATSAPHKIASSSLPVAKSFRVLGVRVDAVQIPEVIGRVEEWIARRDACRYVAVTGMHGVMEAHRDSGFRAVLNEADLVVPDGMPLVWCARLRGYTLPRRVYGPELMHTFCRQTAAKGYRHFLYGGDPSVAEKLAAILKQDCPGIQIAGVYSPPFGELTVEENSEAIGRIHAARPDVLWVGLGTPKQETWMHAHRDSLRVSALIGVGAAFDILSGRKRQAPVWMREHGLEWLFRLLQEPRRLFRRYVVYGSRFVVLETAELLGLRRSS